MYFNSGVNRHVLLEKHMIYLTSYGLDWKRIIMKFSPIFKCILFCQFVTFKQNIHIICFILIS